MAERRISGAEMEMVEAGLLLPNRDTGMGSKINLSLPRSASPVGLSPRKSSLKRSGSLDGPDRDGNRRGSSGSGGQRVSDADVRRTSLRKGSLDRKGSTQSVEERRRVSFPDNERDYLGEADWDYDRTPIEVDFDSCFSNRRSSGKKKRQQFFDRILSPINILIFLVLYIISLAYMILKVMRYI